MSSVSEKGLFVFGHVKDDLLPEPHLGGPASYISVAASRLGLTPHLITKVKKDHKYVRELERLGVIVHNLPVRDKFYGGKVTSGKNFFRPDGGKDQELTERQEDITVDDLSVDEFPGIKHEDIVIIAPDIGEVDTRVFGEIREKIGDDGFLLVSPSGYFRHLQMDGKVRKGPWEEVDVLQYADAAIFSEDDLLFDGQEQLDIIRELTPITIFTRGGEGIDVSMGNENEHIRPLGLSRQELKDFDGAGDATAAAFVWHYHKFGGVKDSSVFGVLYAGLKIKGIGGAERGILALPTLGQVQEFTRENYGRVHEFYQSNGLEVPSFLEGRKNPLEKQ